MNRRTFFQTVFATICAILLPKSKKAELVLDDDQTFIFGQDDDTVFAFTGSDNNTASMVIYGERYDGTYCQLTKDELREIIDNFAKGALERRKMLWEELEEDYRQSYGKEPPWIL